MADKFLIIAVSAIFTLFPVSLYSQTAGSTNGMTGVSQAGSAGNQTAGTGAAADAIQPEGKTSGLPAGFVNILLGMDIEEVKKELSASSWFDYRGEPDVTMLMTRGQQLIECSGNSFIEKGYFQFHNGKLFIITLVLDIQRIDFYTMHTSLEEKYGKAARLDPEGAFWENEDYKLSLEKPLSVKYMDRKIMNEIESGRKETENRAGALREEFIELF